MVERSDRTPWYDGPTLLRHLETVPTMRPGERPAARFPVQYVIRPQRVEHRDYRGYAGTVAAGELRPGDQVIVLPSERRTQSRTSTRSTAPSPSPGRATP